MSQNNSTFMKNMLRNKTEVIHYVCCLKEDGFRCQKLAGNVTFNKIICTTMGELKLSLDPNAGHIYICDLHKSKIQSAQSLKLYKQTKPNPKVDFSQLPLHSLKRYKKHFKVQTDNYINKDQLSQTLFNHFKTIPVNEKEVISLFIKKIKESNVDKNIQIPNE